ncbi:hypothetical protein HanPI659440_Chr05g0205091 [Helianthus annuus]|nr:hypothetical protein HanPI659440_Chr05g0205091 [Helianthus annuus]
MKLECYQQYGGCYSCICLDMITLVVMIVIWEAGLASPMIGLVVGMAVVGTKVVRLVMCKVSMQVGETTSGSSSVFGSSFHYRLGKNPCQNINTSGVRDHGCLEFNKLVYLRVWECETPCDTLLFHQE